MVEFEAFQTDIGKVSAQLRARLGARGQTLQRQLRRAGRALPKSVRAAGQRLVQLQPMVAHPRLRRLVDPAEVDAATGQIMAHLETVDPKERRKDRLLGFAGSAVFNLMLLAAALIVLLRWRGVI